MLFDHLGFWVFVFIPFCLVVYVLLMLPGRRHHGMIIINFVYTQNVFRVCFKGTDLFGWSIVYDDSFLMLAMMLLFILFGWVFDALVRRWLLGLCVLMCIRIVWMTI
ncbi:hypothetical protein Hdeb2414_s0010g00346291 [Helianthus debilis subsp. tardiflorus]